MKKFLILFLTLFLFGFIPKAEKPGIPPDCEKVVSVLKIVLDAYHDNFKVTYVNILDISYSMTVKNCISDDTVEVGVITLITHEEESEQDPTVTEKWCTTIKAAMKASIDKEGKISTFDQTEEGEIVKSEKCN